jgi:hypothetical protein
VNCKDISPKFWKIICKYIPLPAPIFSHRCSWVRLRQSLNTSMQFPDWWRMKAIKLFSVFFLQEYSPHASRRLLNNLGSTRQTKRID